MGGLIKFLLLIAIVAATGFGVYVSLHLDKFFPKPVEVEEEARKPIPKPKVEQVEEEVVDETPKPEPPPPPPPKKTIAQLKAEADAAQVEVDAKIAKAREEGKQPLSGFAGITFGKELDATTIRLEEVAEGGYAAVVLGPKPKKAFLAFSDRPLAWVTPKTKKVYKIEFSTYLNKAAGDLPSPITTNVVAQLSTKLRRDPFCVDAAKFPLAKREYVFPFGQTTLTVREAGGTKLSLVVEHSGIRAKVKDESDSVIRVELAEAGNSKVLGSDKYPNSGKAPMKRMSMKNGTPRSFCGVVFGTLPPYGAVMSNPAKGEKGFFLDYRRAKCAPFMGFNHGRADVSRANGGVHTVHLYSDGPTDGITDKEYFGKVRSAIEKHYKIKQPSNQKGSAEMPDLTYEIGDVEISVGPDSRGGFYLKAVNNKLSLF